MFLPRNRCDGAHSATRRLHLKVVRFRVAAPWGRARSAALRRGLPSRGGSGRGVRAFRGPGAALVELAGTAGVSEGETPCERARGGGSRWATSARLSTLTTPQRMERARRGRTRPAHGSRRRRWPSVHDWPGKRCRRAAPDISRRPGRLGQDRLGAKAPRGSAAIVNATAINVMRIAIGLTRVASPPSSSRPLRRSWRSPRRSRRRSACARAAAKSR